MKKPAVKDEWSLDDWGPIPEPPAPAWEWLLTAGEVLVVAVVFVLGMSVLLLCVVYVVVLAILLCVFPFVVLLAIFLCVFPFVSAGDGSDEEPRS